MLASGDFFRCLMSVHPNQKHGHAKTGKESSEYRSWVDMRNRCSNQKHHAYKDYGGRGISVCERWSEFDNFLADMGPRLSPKHSIDRINNNGNYEPDNCRWATIEEQNRNRRDLVWITYKGKTNHLSGWCKELGFCLQTIHCRLKRGWSIEKSLSTPSLIDRRKKS